jgi:hypothetical protein
MDHILRNLLIGLAVVMLLAFVLGALVGRIARKPAKTISTETSMKLAVNCLRSETIRRLVELGLKVKRT